VKYNSYYELVDFSPTSRDCRCIAVPNLPSNQLTPPQKRCTRFSDPFFSPVYVRP